MSHDIEAAYAALEVVNHLLEKPEDFFSSPPSKISLSGYAAKEGRYERPHADGIVSLLFMGCWIKTCQSQALPHCPAVGFLPAPYNGLLQEAA